MPTEVAQEAPALAPGIRQGNAWKAIRDEASRTERKANAVTALSGRSTADLRRPNAPKAQPSFGRKGPKKDTKVQQDLLLHLPVVLKLQRRLREIRQKHMYKHNDAPLISENVQDLLDEEHSTRRRLNNGEFELTSKGQLLSDVSSHTAGAIGNSLEGAPMKNRVNTMKLLSSGVQRLFGVLAQLTTLGERVMHPLHLLPCIERAAAELIPDCAAVVYDVLAGQSVDAKRRDKSSAGTLVSINRYLKIEAKALPCTCEAVIKSRQAIWHDSAKPCPALAYAEVWRSEESGTTFGSATGAIMGFFFDGEYESMVRQQIAEQGFNIRVDRSRGHLASSIVATPMLDEVGQAQAVLFTHHRKGRGFSADDALILKLLCATAGEILRTAKQISRAMDANVKLTNTIQDVRQHCWEVKDMQNVAKRVIPSDDCLVLTLSGAEKTDLRPLVDCSLATRFFDALKTEMLNTGVSKVYTLSELQLVHCSVRYLARLWRRPEPMGPALSSVPARRPWS